MGGAGNTNILHDVRAGPSELVAGLYGNNIVCVAVKQQNGCRQLVGTAKVVQGSPIDAVPECCDKFAPVVSSPGIPRLRAPRSMVALKFSIGESRMAPRTLPAS